MTAQLLDVFGSMTALSAALNGGRVLDPTCVSCGVPVPRVGRECLACISARARAERAEGLNRAWSTVPETLAWLAFDAAGVEAWVLDVAARAAAKDAFGLPLVTLRGEPGAGKTSLACCMLREHVRRGARASSTPREIWHARRARFVTTCDLIRERDERRLGDDHLPLLEACERASILVLDDLDRASDPRRVIHGLIHARHRHGRQTIVTTALTREECARHHEPGIARRLFDDGLVIEVAKTVDATP
jgi:hypothetical protein